jgi:hypothetical protein
VICWVYSDIDLLENLNFFRDMNEDLGFHPIYDDNIFEYEQTDSPPILRGRLKASLLYWEICW